MKTFLHEDFLLDTETAKTLYHKYAENEPIFDYHNHLAPRVMAEHRRFRNLTQLWLEGDHYKWRAMRACGVDEKFITGDASDYEKFEAWAAVLPKLIGNPLYHWTHLELSRYFGIDELLSPKTAKDIWDRTEAMMRGEGYDCVSLLKKMNVRILCTTDDPADSLEWHEKIRRDESIPFTVRPCFRPDRYILEPDGEAAHKLMEKYGAPDLNTALEKALDHFCENGCLIADHGFAGFPYLTDPAFAERFRFLGKAYAARGIVMQLHLGPIRNTSPRLMKRIGADAGADSIGRSADPEAIAALLAGLERDGALPRTILYNLNPADNMLFATMAVNFAPAVRYGAAWWFNDNIRGMERQLEELMETGALALSPGMLTDSRSFTAFVRHEYFRRILCAKLGRIVEEGLYPADEEMLGAMVKAICYDNAVSFFGA